MIRCGNQIRLHKEDVDWLYKLTGTNPDGIRNVGDLNTFIDRHIPILENDTPESRLLGMLLAEMKIKPEY